MALEADALRTELSVRNTGDRALSFTAALHPYCSDFIAAPRPARRRSPIRRHRNETFAVRLGTRVPRSGVGAGFVYSASLLQYYSTTYHISAYRRS